MSRRVAERRGTSTVVSSRYGSLSPSPPAGHNTRARVVRGHLRVIYVQQCVATLPSLTAGQSDQWRRQGGSGGSFPPYRWTSKNYVICVCVCDFIVMELLRITRQIHCKAVEQRITLIHRQYNRDWGTSYSRPHIDPYLTSLLLQNPGGATESDMDKEVSPIPDRIFGIHSR